MKKVFLFVPLLLVMLLVSCSKKENVSTFSFFPDKPQVGQEIIIKYIPIDKLKDAKSIDMIVYSYGQDLLDTKKITLDKDGNEWLGKFTSKPKTYGLVVKFVNGEIVDNNDEHGYVVYMYKPTEDAVKGASAGLANVYASWAGYVDLKNDKEEAYRLFTEDFEKNPQLKEEFLSGYFKSLPDEIRDSVVDLNLQKIEGKDSLTQSDLEILTNWSGKIGDLVKSKKYLELLEQKYPKSSELVTKYYNIFRSNPNLESKLSTFKQFIKLNEESSLSAYMLNSIVSDLIKNNQLSKAKNMLNEYSSIANSNLYNSISWSLYQSKKNLKEAEKFAEKGVQLAKEELAVPSDKKPAYLDNQEWMQDKRNSLGMILDTYGSIEKALGKKQEALTSFEDAVDNTNSEFPDVNENYVSALYDLGKNKEAKEKIEEYIASGKSTDKMKTMYSDVFIKLGGTKEELNKYFDKMASETNKKLGEKLKNEILDYSAPQFTLTDLDGKTVNLSDYKGKNVIVDFWATWCGPCKRSFEAMNKAVEKYPNVQFLFVNTWERVENKKENAAKFIKDNNYPFHVLLDENNEVVAKYGVQGIPTKFIIDKNGNVRFKSVGYDGNVDGLVNELGQMVSMIQ